MTTQLDERTDTEEVLDTDDPILSHIIERDDNESAPARIMRAAVEGTPVTALCGYTWVPSRDPQKHPICEKCLQLVEFAKNLRS